MDSSDDDDSGNSIPRPIYEATGAIDSPRPVQHELGPDEKEPLSNKHLKYVVSSPPSSATGSNSSISNSSSSWPATSSSSASPLTMKLTKVPQTQTSEAKPVKKPDNQKMRVPKEILALQRSHIESKVLQAYVSDAFRLKRRKSRVAAVQLIKQSVTGGLSTTLPSSSKTANSNKMKLKRSKSIAASPWDSNKDWQSETESTEGIGKCLRRRNRSECDDTASLMDFDTKFNATDTERKASPELHERSRSRSKSVPRRSLRSENDGADWRTSTTLDIDTSMSMISDASEPRNTSSTATAEDELEQHLSTIWQAPPKAGWDPFCWKCCYGGELMPCSKCVRSYHSFCVRPANIKFEAWKCPECQLIENSPKRPRRNEVSVDMLRPLLAFALDRMKLVRGVYKLRAPQDILPETYGKYFVNPVSFESLTERIKSRAFHSTDEFLGEVKWMQHNAQLLQSDTIKAEQTAKAIVKVCRQEVNEIETCPECYMNANSCDDWFVRVCTQPHLLVWAKLKGFPYWPAKAMSAGPNAVVNVRFFGKHDRANVPVKDCFLYSSKDPNTQTSRRSARDLIECIGEVEVHIENIKRKIGNFNYAPYRTLYDPLEEDQQLELMMPGVLNGLNRPEAKPEPTNKTPLQILIRRTADDKLAIVNKTKSTETGNESDHSLSPVKKAPSDTETTTSEHAKPKNSNNYEVIARPGDGLRESRICTVVLKRKHIDPVPEAASCSKRNRSESDGSSEGSQQNEQSQKSEPEHKHKHNEQSQKTEATHKRRSEASQHNEQSQKTDPEHKRRSKSAKKQAHEQANPVEEAAQSPQKQQQPMKQEAAVETNSAVVSVVELVKRRHGVTITKLPREQQQQPPQQQQQSQQQQQQQSQQQEQQRQQQQQLQRQQQEEREQQVQKEREQLLQEEREQQLQKEREQQQQKLQQQQKEQQQEEEQQELLNAKPTEPMVAESVTPAAIVETLAKLAMERQQQQLISKVVPFMEIKKEVMSDEEEEEFTTIKPTPSKESEPSPSTSKSTTVTTETPEADMQIKEEVLSDEEEQTETETISKPVASSSMLPPLVPHRAELQLPSTATTPAAPTTITRITLAPPSSDPYVRFALGDTTIQRLQTKTIHKVPEAAPPPKRSSLRGVPHGPLPAAAQLPDMSAPLSPPHSPPPAPSTSANAMANSSNHNRSNRTSPQLSSNATQQRVRGLPCQTSNSQLPQLQAHPATDSHLLGSNMVVIPLMQCIPDSSSNSSSSNSSSSSSNNNSNLMTVPVPPLRAVSKSTLQAPASSASMSLPVLMPVPALTQFSLPPPATATVTRATPVTETSNLLANALNGRQPDEPLQEKPAAAPAPAPAAESKLATAFSQLITLSGLPKLTPRPAGPLQSDGTGIYPLQSGPLSIRLRDNAHKIADYFISVIEDTMSDLASGDPKVMEARIAGLTLENERMKQHYERQLSDVKRAADLMLAEMRKSIETENKRLLSDLRQQSTMERMRAIEETKKKQWCANCLREATLFCCWNTSYCDYPCQQMHWTSHSDKCGQKKTTSPPDLTTATLSSPHQLLPAAESPRFRLKNSNNNSNGASASTMQAMTRPPAVSAMMGKKWMPQSLIIGPAPPAPPPPNAELLKLPSNTFLRPVSSVPSTNTSNNVSAHTLMAPTTSTHLASQLVATQHGNNITFSNKPQTQPTRFNIPLPITITNNGGSFGQLTTEQQQQHQQQQQQQHQQQQQQHQQQPAKLTRTYGNRARNVHNTSNGNNNNNSQSMRANQVNQMYQQ
ncbi:protein kinase C-binding protein 1 [Drosophila busckii]|uniref:protein kinase C-binding protein 1 n=1 Tax=Drosophila busckii TaxID=30019 RepID=UPI00083EFA51|nr:protein kinase C-binding protein 1 [Drosophila busckii]